jgi:hypothetical protein
MTQTRTLEITAAWEKLPMEKVFIEEAVQWTAIVEDLEQRMWRAADDGGDWCMWDRLLKPARRQSRRGSDRSVRREAGRVDDGARPRLGNGGVQQGAGHSVQPSGTAGAR